MESWIKLYRKFDEWEWFNISEMVHLFIYLLLNANNTDGEWRGVKIKRGQILTGLNSLHQKTKISNQTLRTCLKRLEKTKEINIQVTNKYSIITIYNYDTYQSNQQTTNKQPNKQLTSNQQTTNNKQEYKEDNNVNKEEELRKHTQKFKDSVFSFKDSFENRILEEFFNYWSEVNNSRTKMRFEKEPVFEISKRLATWKRNDEKFKSTNKKEFHATDF